MYKDVVYIGFGAFEFQAPTGGLGTHPPQIRLDDSMKIFQSLSSVGWEALKGINLGMTSDLHSDNYSGYCDRDHVE